MKRIFTFLAVAALCLVSGNYANAQCDRNTHSVGAIFSIASGEVGGGQNYTNYGIGAKYQWTFLQNMRLEPSVIYYFKKDKVSGVDLTANFHYLFPVTSVVTLYPIAGIGISNFEADLGGGDSESTNKFAFNFGGGFQYMFTHNWGMAMEYKYRIIDNLNRNNFQFSAIYRF